MNKHLITSLLTALLVNYSPISHAQSGPAKRGPTTLRWPAITQQTRPWTRWWWQGSAVNDTDLTHLLTQYRNAGLGGVEITPIYGVRGEEARFVDFLSPTWMDRLAHTLTTAKRLGLGVDLAQASGWPFGGPWVSPADACKYLAVKTFSVKPGASLPEPVRYGQPGLVRAVGESISLDKLTDPIGQSIDRQRYALDQVRFAKPLPLQSLMAYPAQGAALDLTDLVDSTGRLTWIAPGDAPGGYTLHALFQGWHGKQVERAGPGGEGDVIDHFSRTATEHYLQRFDAAFRGRDLRGLRAFFNDSYEVDDAQGEANWTPTFFADFRQRRGYDLRQHLPALFANDTTEQATRIRSDYRETISDLLLDNYTKTWHRWAEKWGKPIRNQAHGSPANILDLYAATDIPECEGTDLLRIKFASSAAHVTGKPLASSESATWNNEHFLSRLSDLKTDLDRLLLGGVNHAFYHGTNYSPRGAAWPGWLFYAAVHVNPNNTFWADFGTLNSYVARCQSFLQAGRPDNDVLVYLPIFDAYARPVTVRPGTAPTATPGLLQHFDGMEHGFKGLPVEQHAQTLLDKGYGFDFISDRQLLGVSTAGGRLLTGGNTYQTILVPDARRMPIATLTYLLTLAQNGATVLFVNALPADVPGLTDLDNRQSAVKKLLDQLQFAETEIPGVRRAVAGAGAHPGAVLVGSEVEKVLIASGLGRETMVDAGLSYIRRRHATGRYYFIVNTSTKAVSGWVPLQVPARSVALFDPMTGQAGLARHRLTNGMMELYLQLAPGETCLLDTRQTPQSGPAYAYAIPTGPAQPITGTWTVNFTTGGPTLPAPVQTDTLRSWTTFGGEAVKNFSGAATYTIAFARPTGPATAWQLDLGSVAESARIRLNGHDLGTLIGPAYRLVVPANLLTIRNILSVTVSNGMANRVADMDRKGVVWQKFYNINMPARLRENRDASGNFTAERWTPRPSGLLGPVTLTPVGTLPVFAK